MSNPVPVPTACALVHRMHEIGVDILLYKSQDLAREALKRAARTYGNTSPTTPDHWFKSPDETWYVDLLTIRETDDITIPDDYFTKSLPKPADYTSNSEAPSELLCDLNGPCSGPYGCMCYTR